MEFTEKKKCLEQMGKRPPHTGNTFHIVPHKVAQFAEFCSVLGLWRIIDSYTPHIFVITISVRGSEESRSLLHSNRVDTTVICGFVILFLGFCCLVCVCVCVRVYMCVRVSLWWMSCYHFGSCNSQMFSLLYVIPATQPEDKLSQMRRKLVCCWSWKTRPLWRSY